MPILKPVLDEMTGRLTMAFNDAALHHKNVEPFLQFYQGEKFNALRQKVQKLSLDETAQLRETMKQIDSGIKTGFNQYSKGKPANNNEKPHKSKTPHAPHRHKQKKHKRHHWH